MTNWMSSPRRDRAACARSYFPSASSTASSAAAPSATTPSAVTAIKYSPGAIQPSTAAACPTESSSAATTCASDCGFVTAISLTRPSSGAASRAWALSESRAGSAVVKRYKWVSPAWLRSPDNIDVSLAVHITGTAANVAGAKVAAASKSTRRSSGSACQADKLRRRAHREAHRDSRRRLSDQNWPPALHRCFSVLPGRANRPVAPPLLANAPNAQPWQ